MRIKEGMLGMVETAHTRTLYRPGNNWINDSSAYGHFGKNAWLMTPRYGVLL